ncbi:MAG: hypothetical protein RIF39_15670, partial [Cyclobacteriaceae bacterium]
MRQSSKYIIIFWLALTLLSPAFAQTKFPVTVSTSINPPYSPYLGDYISPASNQLNCNFVFNDFREPSWQVR